MNSTGEALDEAERPTRPNPETRGLTGRFLAWLIIAGVFYVVLLPVLLPRPTVRATFASPDPAGHIPLLVDVLSFDYFTLTTDMVAAELRLDDNSTTIVRCELRPNYASMSEITPFKIMLACLPAPRRRHFTLLADLPGTGTLTRAAKSGIFSTRITTTSSRAPLWLHFVAHTLRSGHWGNRALHEGKVDVCTEVKLAAAP